MKLLTNTNKLLIIVVTFLTLTGCGIVGTIKCGSAPQEACHRPAIAGIEL